jgi:hypothetical protein
MRLIHDTVTFIWAVSTPERLSRTAMSALRKPTAVREISVVSLTEIAVKQTRGKLTFGKAEAMAGVADLRACGSYRTPQSMPSFCSTCPHIMPIPSTAKSSRKRSWRTSRS